jgi:hypothetical protein
MIPKNLSISPWVVGFHSQYLDRLLISWACKYYSVYRFVSRTIRSITIDRIDHIILGSRSYFFDESMIFYKFSIRFRCYFIPDVSAHRVIRHFFVGASRFKVHSIQIII